jgi:TIR domain
MPGGIFVSYRRNDSPGFAGRIGDRLISHFGHENVFIDIDSIPPGVDFVKVLSEHVADCAVLVAVIGKKWLTVTDEHDRRRLEDPNDYLRIEIESALKRDIRVIPVLVDGATIPDQDELPNGLKPLAHRNGIDISYTRFDSDAQRLIEAIVAVTGEPGKRNWTSSQKLPSAKARILVLGGALGLAVLLALLWTVFAPGRPDACRQGFVWRGAAPNDHVCVTPQTRSQTAADNAAAGSRINPNGGPYGSLTCLQGFVWREALKGDTVCVTPATRAQAAADNAEAPNRRAP